LRRQTTLPLTGNVAPQHKPEDDTMITNNPTPETSQSFTDPEAATSAMRDADPDYALADAEEEEFAELWAADRGNQGA
jgi:hypothetical protein